MGNKPKTGRSRSAEAASVRTLERGLMVLSALAALGQASLMQIARQAGLSGSTTYRLLETLRQNGFIDWDEYSGQFSVGLRAYQVGLAFAEQNTLIRVAHSEMQALVAQLNESANFAVLRGPEAVYIHQVEGRQLVRMFTQLGATAPLHCSGVGKVLLSGLSHTQLAQKLGPEPYQSYTPHSITTLPAFSAELEKVRQQGYALDDEEREIGVRCVAMPIWNQHGEIIAALSISAPVMRLPLANLPSITAALSQSTQQISRRLGTNIKL